MASIDDEGAQGAGETPSVGGGGVAVTLDEVLAACTELAEAGDRVTRRAVRAILGRGSMATIHKGVSEFELRQSAHAPKLDLTAADRDVISELGARALAVAEERVRHVLSERERVLLAQVEAADGRAQDAAEAADVAISGVLAEVAQFRASAEASGRALEAANTLAHEAERRTERAEGRAAQLLDDRIAVENRLDEANDVIADLGAQLASEKALREKADALTRDLEIRLEGLKSEYGQRKEQDAAALARLSSELALERDRNQDLHRQTLAARADFAKLELLVKEQAEFIVTLRMEGTSAAAALRERDLAVDRLRQDVSAEKDRAAELLEHAAAALRDRDLAIDRLRQDVSAEKDRGVELFGHLDGFVSRTGFEEFEQRIAQQIDQLTDIVRSKIPSQGDNSEMS